MAFPEKVTKRENKVLGWFLSILGGLLLFGSLQIVKPTEPSPISIPLVVSSGLMFLLGIYCLFNKPTAVIVILGGISFAATIDDEMVVDIWAGHADVAKTRPWEHDTIGNVWPTTKSLVMMCIHILVDRGLLDLEAPVSGYWSKFAF